MKNEKNMELREIKHSELDKISGGSVSKYTYFGYYGDGERREETSYRIHPDDNEYVGDVYETFDDFELASKADRSRGGSGKLTREKVVGHNKL